MAKQKKDTTNKKNKQNQVESKSEPKVELQLESEPEEQLIQFTTLQKGTVTPPQKSQKAKFKVPETNLIINGNSINVTTYLPETKVTDIALTLTEDSLIILGKNNKVAYYTDIKLPHRIIPQSAVAKFKNGAIHFNIIKSDGTEPWEGMVKVGRLNRDLMDAKDRLVKIQQQYHAIQLDYQNLLVRSKKEVEEKVDTYKIAVIERLLKNIEHFELALASASKLKTKVENKDTEQILLGIQLILNDLKNMVKEEGVLEIPTKGMQMDPNQHEVVECEETDKYPENTILEEFQKGYRYRNRILRPSKVKVSVAPKKKQSKKVKKK